MLNRSGKPLRHPKAQCPSLENLTNRRKSEPFATLRAGSGLTLRENIILDPRLAPKKRARTLRHAQGRLWATFAKSEREPFGMLRAGSGPPSQKASGEPFGTLRAGSGPPSEVSSAPGEKQVLRCASLRLRSGQALAALSRAAQDDNDERV